MTDRETERALAEWQERAFGGPTGWRLSAAALLAAILYLIFVSVAGAKPNIVLIITDDQTNNMIVGRDASGQHFMPYLMSKAPMARRFTNSIYSQSLCCPSRTSTLTGMYPHNHGVTSNKGEFGGYPRYMANGLDHKSWPWLLKPEYYTGFFGKFLNRYSDPSSVPVGYSRWYSIYYGAGHMYNWNASHNGTPVAYRGTTDATYSTNVLANLVATTIEQKQGSPFALLFFPAAPHLPARPAQEFAGTYAAEPFAPALKDNFNEDTSDKPSHMQRGPLTTGEKQRLQSEWRRMLDSGRSIDKAFRTIWMKLWQTGQLDNTYVIFASDNGYLWGEHRVEAKLYPYRESIQSTMLIWGPGVVPGYDNHLVTNADLMPTFMEISGKVTPEWTDGRSLMPLLRGENPASWRRQLLVHGRPDGTDKDYHSLATRNWTFTQYNNGEIEFYDLRTDPMEMTNTASSLSPERVDALIQRLDELYVCAGETCRATEDQDPP